MFSPHAAPRTGTSAANEAQCCLVAGFLVVFFIVSFDDNVAKRNIKQKLFCEKQGKRHKSRHLSAVVYFDLYKVRQPLHTLQQSFVLCKSLVAA